MLKLLFCYHPLLRWGYDVQILLVVKLFLGRFAVISGGKADFLRRGELGGTAMNKQSSRQASIESFKKDPDYAAEYLSCAWIRRPGRVYGCLASYRRCFWHESHSGNAKLNSKSLYSTLFSVGNLELRSFQAIFRAMGMRLSVTPLTLKSTNDLDSNILFDENMRQFEFWNETSSSLVYRLELKCDLRYLQRRSIIKEAVQPTFRTAGLGYAEILSDYGESGGKQCTIA